MISWVISKPMIHQLKFGGDGENWTPDLRIMNPKITYFILFYLVLLLFTNFTMSSHIKAFRAFSLHVLP